MAVAGLTAAPLGTAMMISAEGSDRTGLVLDLNENLAADYPHVGHHPVSPAAPDPG
jgi:hypothetical protein